MELNVGALSTISLYKSVQPCVIIVRKKDENLSNLFAKD